MTRVDLTGADVVDAHCHPFRSQDLLDRDPNAFETRCMYLGTALISSNHANHDLAAFVEELTETTLFGLALRRWLAGYLGCEPTKEAVVAARDAALRADPPGYVRGLLGSEQRRRRHRRRGLPAADDPARGLRGRARRRAGAPRRPDRAVDRRRARGGHVRRDGRSGSRRPCTRAATTRG